MRKLDAERNALTRANIAKLFFCSPAPVYQALFFIYIHQKWLSFLQIIHRANKIEFIDTYSFSELLVQGRNKINGLQTQHSL